SISLLRRIDIDPLIDLHPLLTVDNPIERNQGVPECLESLFPPATDPVVVKH
ncbi:unnamed protein product, partial [Larinioides sclopetarius]